MLTFHFILLLLALISFFAAAVGIKSERVNLTALGLALATLSVLIPK